MHSIELWGLLAGVFCTGMAGIYFKPPDAPAAWPAVHLLAAVGSGVFMRWLGVLPGVLLGGAARVLFKGLGDERAERWASVVRFTVVTITAVLLALGCVALMRKRLM